MAFDAAGEQYVQDTIDRTIQNVVGDGGTEAELNEKLQSYYMDLDLFKYFTKTQYLYNGLASKLFGENGANISDEDVQEYAEANSYMTAKHILFKTKDDSGPFGRRQGRQEAAGRAGRSTAESRDRSRQARGAV